MFVSCKCISHILEACSIILYPSSPLEKLTKGCQVRALHEGPGGQNTPSWLSSARSSPYWITSNEREKDMERGGKAHGTPPVRGIVGLMHRMRPGDS